MRRTSLSILFPTRRSSDLVPHIIDEHIVGALAPLLDRDPSLAETAYHEIEHWAIDRKSTRLNSSHVAISYAVYCLKKKIFPKIAIDEWIKQTSDHLNHNRQ